MLTINDINYEDDGRAIAINEFPIKKLVIRGKCLLRVGTLYEVFHVENLPNYELVIHLPRDVILVMIFSYYIDDLAWENMYQPSPRQLASLCSIVINENKVTVPVKCLSITARYPFENDDKFVYFYSYFGCIPVSEFYDESGDYETTDSDDFNITSEED